MIWSSINNKTILYYTSGLVLE